MGFKQIISLVNLITIAICSSCSTDDYAAVVGGYGHEVDNVKIAVDSDENLLVGGSMTKSLASYSSTFFYMFLTNGNCQVSWRYEFGDFDEGVGAVAFNDDESYAYMLAYTSDTEYVVMMRDPYLTIGSTSDGYPMIYEIQSVSSDEYRQLNHAALIPVPNINYKMIKVDSRKTTII